MSKENTAFKKNYSIRVRDPEIADFITRLGKEAGAGKSDAAVIVDLLHEAYATENNKKIVRYDVLDPAAKGTINKIKRAQERRSYALRKTVRMLQQLLDEGYSSPKLSRCEQKLLDGIEQVEKDYINLLSVAKLELLHDEFEMKLLEEYKRESGRTIAEVQKRLYALLNKEYRTEIAIGPDGIESKRVPI
jgi:hypothetical protein